MTTEEACEMRIYIMTPDFRSRAVFLRAFHLTGVEILMGDILTVAEDTLVSPANSHGYLDGGIDQVYRKAFGPGLEKDLLQAIDRLGGILPIGRALTIATPEHRSVRRIIFAPTMEMPEAIPAVNVFRATLAALKEVSRINKASPPDVANVAEGATKGPIRQVWFPAMGTGVGEVDPVDAAGEMRLALDRWER